MKVVLLSDMISSFKQYFYSVVKTNECVFIYADTCILVICYNKARLYSLSPNISR